MRSPGCILKGLLGSNSQLRLRGWLLCQAGSSIRRRTGGLLGRGARRVLFWGWTSGVCCGSRANWIC